MGTALGWHRAFICKPLGHMHTEETELACVANTLAALRGDFSTKADVEAVRRLVAEGKM